MRFHLLSKHGAFNLSNLRAGSANCASRSFSSRGSVPGLCDDSAFFTNRAFRELPGLAALAWASTTTALQVRTKLKLKARLFGYDVAWPQHQRRRWHKRVIRCRCLQAHTIAEKCRLMCEAVSRKKPTTVLVCLLLRPWQRYRFLGQEDALNTFENQNVYF